VRLSAMQALETAPTGKSMKTSSLNNLIRMYRYVCFVPSTQSANIIFCHETGQRAQRPLELETRICLKSRPETNNGIIRMWLFSKLMAALSGTFL
jgi:hypothetical protein